MKTTNEAVQTILSETSRRKKKYAAKHDPLTGKGCIGKRTQLILPDYSIEMHGEIKALPFQLIPVEMLQERLIYKLRKAGSIAQYIKDYSQRESPEIVMQKVADIREKYDFQYWAYTQILIEEREKSLFIPFKLEYGQIKALLKCETMRLDEKPIILFVHHAICCEIISFSVFYQLWLAFKWAPEYKFSICTATDSKAILVRKMLDTAVLNYNAKSLGVQGQLKMSHIPKTSEYIFLDTANNKQIRNNRIRIGSAQEPDNLRGLPGSGVHLSDVAVWSGSQMYVEGLMKSMIGGILPKPYTVRIIETRPGDNDAYVHRALVDAENGDSECTTLFLPWFYNQRKTLPIADTKNFALALLSRRDNKDCISVFEDSGKVLWRLWKLGATLESLLWYIYKRKEFRTTGEMRSYFPSESPYRRTWV